MTKHPDSLQALIDQLATTDSTPALTPDTPWADIQSHPALKSRDGVFRFSVNLSIFKSRESYIEQFGFVVLSHELLNVLTDILGTRKVLDIGSGTGYLSSRLTARGVAITAADLGLEVSAAYGMATTHQRDYLGDALALIPGDFEAFILSWPPYDAPLAEQVALAMRPHQLLVYQGEGPGGCTASHAFFELLDDTTQWTQLSELTSALNRYHLQFNGIHDRWSVWQKL